jgi:phage-related protein
MSDRTLKLSIAFQALDKLSGTLKRLSAGSKGLGREFKELKKATSGLQSTQNQIGKVTGLQKSVTENHRATDELRRKMRQLRAEMDQAGKPTKEMRTQLRELEKEERRLGSTIKGQNAKITEHKEKLREAGVNVNNLAEEERRLSSEIAESTANLQKKERQFKRVTELESRAAQMRATGEKVTSVGIGASVAAAPIIAVGQAAFRAASDVNELESAFDVTFGTASGAARKWSIETGNRLQRSTQEMEAMVASYQDILKKQMDPAQAVEMSKKLTLLTQDLASFKNLSNDVAKEKIFSGLIGEAEPLRAVGVLLSDNAVQAKAASMGFKKVGKEYTEGAKVQARAALIMEQLKDAQGDIMRTQSSTENRLKAAGAAWDELKVTLGQKLLPILTPVVDKIAQLLDAFGNMPPGFQEFIIWAGLAVAVLGPALLVIGGMISAFGVLAGVAAGLEIAMLPLLGIVAVIVGALVLAALVIYRNWDKIKAWFQQNIAPLFDRIAKRIEPLKAKFSTLFGKAEQAGRAFMGLLQQLWNGPLGQKIRIVMNLVTQLAGIFASAIGNQIMIIIDTLMGVAGGLFDMLTNGFHLVSALLQGDFAGAWEAVKGIFAGGADALVAIWNGLKATFFNIGGAILDGLVAGIRAGFDWVKSTVSELADMLPEWIKKPLGVHSPSRVFMAIGGHLTSGLAVGVQKTQNHPVNAIRRMATGVAAAGAISLAPVQAAMPRVAAPSLVRAAGSIGTSAPPTAAAPITINVHAAPGMDVKDLARQVRRELEAAQGVAARSRYDTDGR